MTRSRAKLGGTAAEVLSGQRAWSCERADVLEWLQALPPSSIDLLVCSPYYEKQRRECGFPVLSGEAWVAWMVRVVLASLRVCRGPCVFVIEAPTKNYRWSGTPFLLGADLIRAGVILRKPPAFARHGIAGSGGPDWWRNDYEFCLVATRGGRLPWSDPTVDGHPPRWAPGGAMSHRLSDGTRINQWGKTADTAATTTDRRGVTWSGRAPKPSHRMLTKKQLLAAGVNLGTATSAVIDGDAQTKPNNYLPPAIANPGNVIRPKHECRECSDLIWLTVGGGQMGHAEAYGNEAPYPVKLPARFVRAFCPPGGIVADPFSGSGTTLQASIENGRRFIGCDLRASEVQRTVRRARDVERQMRGA